MCKCYNVSVKKKDSTYGGRKMKLVAENYLEGDLRDFMVADVRTMFRLSVSDLREHVYDTVLIVDENRSVRYMLWRDREGRIMMNRYSDSRTFVLKEA